MDPSAVNAGNDTLSTENETEACAILIDRLEDLSDLVKRKFLRCLASPACKNLVGVVMMVIMTA